MRGSSSAQCIEGGWGAVSWRLEAGGWALGIGRMTERLSLFSKQKRRRRKHHGSPGVFPGLTTFLVIFSTDFKYQFG